MDIYIQNATPASFHLGTNDKSGRVQEVVSIPRPPLLSYVPFYAEKGPTEEVMVDGNSFSNIFGAKTLDPLSPFYNHSSVFLQAILQDAGTVIAKRIVPKGAEAVAGLRIYLEYYEDEIDVKERDASGQFKRDQQGAFVTTGAKTPGIKYRFVVDKIPTTTIQIGTTTKEISDFGKGAESVAAGFNNGTGVDGKRIPIMDLSTGSPGAWGNLCGISIWAPTKEDKTPINSSILSTAKAYPFRLSVKVKATPTSNPTVSSTIAGAREIDFVFKPGSTTNSGLEVYLDDTFLKEYNNLIPDDAATPPTFGAFSGFHLYQRNIEAILEMATKKETDSEQIGDFTGFNPQELQEAKYFFNLLGGTHSDGSPYQTFVYERGTGTTATLMSESIDHWAQGGTDGNMNDRDFEASVDAILEEFTNPNSKYHDNVTFNDSTFWDSGYSLEFKKKIGRYLTDRKDRWVGCTTHVAGEGVLTPAEENARLTTIVAALKLYPDSALFGTPNFRAIVVKGSGNFLKSVSTYRPRVPVLYELLRMTTKYWGRQSGIANPRYDFSEGDNNFLKYLTNISNPWTPYVVRNTAWAAGGMWCERSESGKFYFPALHTIYEDDSSTLSNFRTMLAHVEVNKIGAELHRRFTGKDWPEERLKQESEDWFYSKVKDNKFGGKIQIRGEMFFTKIDQAKGYAWHFKVEIYSGSYHSIQTFFSENYRLSDLPDNFTGITS